MNQICFSMEPGNCGVLPRETEGTKRGLPLQAFGYVNSAKAIVRSRCRKQQECILFTSA